MKFFSKWLIVAITLFIMFTSSFMGYIPDLNATNYSNSAPIGSNQPPIANAGLDQNNVIVNTTVTLNGSASFDPDGFIIEYNWTLWSAPSNSNASLNDSSYVKPFIVLDKIGIYYWSLKVKDNNSNWSSMDFVNITVIENRVPIVNISSPQQLAIFIRLEKIDFISNGTYDPDDDKNGNTKIDNNEQDNLTYRWSSNVQGLLSSNRNCYIENLTEGYHYIELRIMDLFGAINYTTVKIKIINPSPVLYDYHPKTLDFSMYENEALAFDMKAYDLYAPEGLYYSFYIDGQYVEDPPDPDIGVMSFGFGHYTFNNNVSLEIDFTFKPHYNFEGFHRITLYITDKVDFVNVVWNITVINVNRAPIAKFKISGYPYNVGEWIELDASESEDPDGYVDENKFKFEWDLDSTVDKDGDGNFTNDRELTGKIVKHRYLRGGDYHITLTLDDGHDKDNLATLTKGQHINLPPVADAGPDIHGVFVNDSVILNASGSDDKDGKRYLDYKWVFEKGFEKYNTDWLSEPYYEVVFDKPEEYIITLNVSDGSAWDIDTVKVTVLKRNSVPIAVAGDDLTNVDVNQILNFSGYNCSDPDINDALIYTWDFGDGSKAVNGINVFHQYFDNGIYTVTLNVTDGKDWALDTLQVIVKPQPPIIQLPEDGATVEKLVILLGQSNAKDIEKVEIKTGWNYWQKVIPIEKDDWSSWTYEWDTTRVENGKYRMSARVVTDYASSESSFIYLNVLNTGPISISITSPSINEIIKENTYIRGTTSGKNIQLVEIQIDDSGWEVATDISSTKNWSEWNYFLDISTLENKIYIISARVITDYANTTEMRTVYILKDDNNETKTDKNKNDQNVSALDITRLSLIIIVIICLILILLMKILFKKGHQNIGKKNNKNDIENHSK